MGHKKKHFDPWGQAVLKVFSRKRADRKYILPKDYLLSQADKLHRQNPTLQIVYNTLRDVYETAADKFYQRAIADNKFFRDARKRAMKDSFDKEITAIEDRIHGKVKKA